MDGEAAERIARRLGRELLETRHALSRVRCFAALPGGARCSRKAWQARNRRPVCTQHRRAKTITWALPEDHVEGRDA